MIKRETNRVVDVAGEYSDKYVPRDYKPVKYRIHGDWTRSPKSEQLRENIKDQVTYIHDKFHPEVMFLTLTGSAACGDMIKEIYKTAWPNEPVPKMLVVNAKNLRYNTLVPHKYDSVPSNLQTRYMADERYADQKEISKGFRRGEWDNNPRFKALVDELEGKLKKYRVKGNVAVIDEMFTFDPKTNPNEDTDPEGVHTWSIVDRGLRIALDKLGIKKKVVAGGFGGGFGGFFGSYWKSDYLREQPRPGFQVGNVTDYRVRRVQGEERKYAKEHVASARKLGEEVGREIRAEEERRKDLESRITSVIAIGSFALSLFFLSGITGNVIGLNQTSAVPIGGILFIIGILGASAWIKRR